MFSQKGYLGTSIEEIVEAAESSKGNLYYHFKSKEGLFLHLLVEQVDEWLVQWSVKENHYRTATEKLYGLAEHVADDLRNPLMKAADEFRSSVAADPAVAEQIKIAVRRQREIFHSVIQEALEEEEIGGYDREQLAMILYALIAGLGTVRHERRLEEITSLHHTAISIFLHGTANAKS
ncbi:TetR/AcrR family transcriptional regulator [Brevibacillus invocatus]|uniref:TetR/AcrR family transcriptional regulator n=1 Tax=Brevibacillus invocatus TaxID=173959 RepID=UPI001FEC74F9|nr:TetR/AcrR family transcriptional regulator [Brevibacillus invocatus]MCM3079314.1 TetR/AcrR family transcriptional regulator [Brevibacillus invocatus]MCM3429412.1 TetR/AcrR family transcriptional regulator [Brevibacillus invocatus]